MAKKRKAIWRLNTYDLLPDGEGSWSVNDVYPAGEVTLNIELVTFNPGLDSEFYGSSITDLAINRALGFRNIEWDGDTPTDINLMGILYGNFKRGKFAGSPACELIFERWSDEE